MGETTEQRSVLEIELEKYNLPQNYNPHSEYSRPQQFQAYLVGELAQLNYDRLVQLEGIGLEHVRRGIDAHVHVLRVNITEPKKVKKYVQSALYLRAVNRTVAKILRLALAPHEDGFLDNIAAMNTALYKDVIGLLSLRPNVFPNVYQKCVNELEEISRPLRILLGYVEETLLKRLEDSEEESSQCEQDWESEYEKCVEHLEKLKLRKLRTTLQPTQ